MVAVVSAVVVAAVGLIYIVAQSRGGKRRLVIDQTKNGVWC